MRREETPLRSLPYSWHCLLAKPEGHTPRPGLWSCWDAPPTPWTPSLSLGRRRQLSVSGFPVLCSVTTLPSRSSSGDSDTTASVLPHRPGSLLIQKAREVKAGTFPPLPVPVVTDASVKRAPGPLGLSCPTPGLSAREPVHLWAPPLPSSPGTLFLCLRKNFPIISISSSLFPAHPLEPS